MRIEALANPKLLIWARQTAGLKLADVACKARVKPEALVKWEADERRPTIAQLRRLADVHKQILGVFYLNDLRRRWSRCMCFGSRGAQESRGRVAHGAHA